MRVRREAVLDAAEVERALRPRDGLILEVANGGGVFTQAEGPLHTYHRSVMITPAATTFNVRQTVEFQLGLPYFSALFVLPLRWALGTVRPADHPPWWAPPQRLDRRAAEVLATVCALAVVIGFVGSILALTMTYAAAEFGTSRADQGVALGVVRANVVLALGILILADRRGRRQLTLGCAAGAVLLTSLGALAPSLAWLTLTQIVAVALTAALLVLVGVLAAEEMPAGSRAWALALLTMSVGLGGGLATAALPLAGLGTRGWRWLYAAALLFLPLVASVRRHLPESLRWQQELLDPRHAIEIRSHSSRRRSPSGEPRRSGQSFDRRRLALLCAGGFLFSLFATPSSQFSNEFLRTERAFSATRIAVFSLVCGTIGGLGVLIGGRLADLRGRRLVAAVGVGGGIVTTVSMYFSRGWPLWAWGVADNLLGYAVAPALAIYGPELFPTRQRSRATGVIGIAYAAGGVVGLIVVGVLSGHFGTFGPAFAVVAIGPAALVVLIVRAYPETARRTLEELNGDDRGP